MMEKQKKWTKIRGFEGDGAQIYIYEFTILGGTYFKRSI
jgi:hypothetical protein